MKRVKATMLTKYDSISEEYNYTLYQYLQEKKQFKIFGITLFIYWKTIDTEIVPSFAWIQHNTLGSTEWKSKWNGLENVNWNKIK